MRSVSLLSNLLRRYNELMHKLLTTLRLPFQALAIAVVVICLRIIADAAGLERIQINALVGAIITANVFILGFLLGGVMSDYKESEKMPGDLAVSLGTIGDEFDLLWRHKQAQAAHDGLESVLSITRSMLGWFYKCVRSADLMNEVSSLGDRFQALESHTQPNFIVRLKQEQTSIFRMLTRVHTIRETSFAASGYVMAKLATVLVLSGLLAIEVDHWYESVFLVGMLAWFLSYLILLIGDLDNPFDYSTNGRPRGQEVSLKPLQDLEARLVRQIGLEEEAISAAMASVTK